MKRSLYLETTVVSYLTSLPSRDIILLAHQEITRIWWPMALSRYDIFISGIVLEEARLGDAEASRLRLEVLQEFPILELNHDVEERTRLYLDTTGIPSRSFRDAAHLAVASVHGIDFLVTWNCSHLANGEIIKNLLKINSERGYHTPVVVTPEELMEG